MSGGSGLDAALRDAGPDGHRHDRGLAHLPRAGRRRLGRPPDRLAARARRRRRPAGAASRPRAGRVGLHRRQRGPAGAGRAHRVRLRHRAPRRVRHRPDHRVHGRPGHGWLPGPAAVGSGPPLATAADGAPLAPCRIFVEADPAAPAGQPGGIGRLVVDHSILGPVRTRTGGSVQTLTISDSIVQGLRAAEGTAFTAATSSTRRCWPGGSRPATRIRAARRPAGGRAARHHAPAEAAAVLAYASGSPPGSGFPPDSGSQLGDFPLGGLNTLVSSAASLYQPGLFAAVRLSPRVLARVAQAEAGTLAPARLPALNRALLEEVFPVALGVAALAVADATVQLARVTVLGRVAAHRLSASDSILAGFAVVEDVQDGLRAVQRLRQRERPAAAVPVGGHRAGHAHLHQRLVRPAGLRAADRERGRAITGGTSGASHRRRRRERLGDGCLLRGPATPSRSRACSSSTASTCRSGSRPCSSTSHEYRPGRSGTQKGSRWPLTARE